MNDVFIFLVRFYKKQEVLNGILNRQNNHLHFIQFNIYFWGGQLFRNIKSL